MALKSINPATGETLATFDTLSPAAVEDKLQRAVAAFASWRQTAYADRARLLMRAADILEKESEQLGRLMTLEMGKPLRPGVDEALKCARGCRYYAEHGATFLADEHVADRGARQLRPLRAARRRARHHAVELPVLAGLPLRRAGADGRQRRAAQARVERAAVRARDRGHLSPRRLSGRRLPDAPRFARPMWLHCSPMRGSSAVTLTGSEGAGQRRGGAGGTRAQEDRARARRQRSVHRHAQRRSREGRGHRGQGADDQQRAIVHRGEAFHRCRGRRRSIPARSFVAAMEALKVGDPLDAATDVGPLATPDLVTISRSRSTRRVAAGARILTGGARLPGPGNYFAPTVLVDIPRDSPAYREELFGPVARVFRVARSTRRFASPTTRRFGLGASVWTSDDAERERFVREIEAGQVFVNGMVVVRSAPAVRRRQALGLRPRARRPWHPRVRQHQDRVGRRLNQRRYQLSPPDHSSDARRGRQRCRHASSPHVERGTNPVRAAHLLPHRPRGRRTRLEGCPRRCLRRHALGAAGRNPLAGPVTA